MTYIFFPTINLVGSNPLLFIFFNVQMYYFVLFFRLSNLLIFFFKLSATRSMLEISSSSPKYKYSNFVFIFKSLLHMAYKLSMT